MWTDFGNATMESFILAARLSGMAVPPRNEAATNLYPSWAVRDEQSRLRADVTNLCPSWAVRADDQSRLRADVTNLCPSRAVRADDQLSFH